VEKPRIELGRGTPLAGGFRVAEGSSLVATTFPIPSKAEQGGEDLTAVLHLSDDVGTVVRRYLRQAERLGYSVELLQCDGDTEFVVCDAVTRSRGGELFSMVAIQGRTTYTDATALSSGAWISYSAAATVQPQPFTPPTTFQVPPVPLTRHREEIPDVGEVIDRDRFTPAFAPRVLPKTRAVAVPTYTGHGTGGFVAVLQGIGLSAAQLDRRYAAEVERLTGFRPETHVEGTSPDGRASVFSLWPGHAGGFRVSQWTITTGNGTYLLMRAGEGD
jgi:hypothetical protein